MKTNKHKDIYFVLGTFDEKSFKGKGLYTVQKKSQIERRAHLLLVKNGYVWIKVVYGKGKDVFGKVTQIYNDGVYKSLSEFKIALASFIEQPLVDYLQS